jgi:hypothetical protein
MKCGWSRWFVYDPETCMRVATNEIVVHSVSKAQCLMAATTYSVSSCCFVLAQMYGTPMKKIVALGDIRRVHATA